MRTKEEEEEHSYGDRQKCDFKKMTVVVKKFMAISEAESFRSAH